MRILGRFVVLAFVMFWLGGFTFYTSIVVKIGTDQLGKDGQGFITREVTRSINGAGVAALLILLGEVLLTPESSPKRRWWRLGLWLFMVGCQITLYVLHAHLDSFLNPETQSVNQRPAFYQWHRLYLWLHTAQWAAMLVYLVLMLAAWRSADARSGSVEETSSPGPLSET